MDHPRSALRICTLEIAEKPFYPAQTRATVIHSRAQFQPAGTRHFPSPIARRTEDMEAARTLVQAMWKIDLDESTERKGDAYLRYCEDQGLHALEEALFITELLQKNADVPRSALKESVANIQRHIHARGPSNGVFSGYTALGAINVPAMVTGVEQRVFHPTFDIDRALAKGVRMMLATDLAMDRDFVSSHSITVWDDSQSLRTILESSLPRLRHTPAPSVSQLMAPPQMVAGKASQRLRKRGNSMDEALARPP